MKKCLNCGTINNDNELSCVKCHKYSEFKAIKENYTIKKCLSCGKMNDSLVSWCVDCHGTNFEEIAIQKTEIKDYIIREIPEEAKVLASNGNNNAKAFLGRIYLFGLYDVDKDIEKAKQIFIKLKNNGYTGAEKYLQICENGVYDIEKLLLENNNNKFPAFICKNCESIIPIYSLDYNSHRSIQTYGTNIFKTIATQFAFDIFLSSNNYACSICCSEDLITLGSPLAESLIKEHSTNKEYQNILLSYPNMIIRMYNKYKVKDLKYNKNNGCYIATAVYNSYDCPQVWTLRRFRDYCLLRHFFGKIFVKLYYFISPMVVKYFGKTKIFNVIFKNILDKFVNYLNDKGYKDTEYKDK